MAALGALEMVEIPGQENRSLRERRWWRDLEQYEKWLLFDRLHNRILSRVPVSLEWAILFAKSLLTVNGTGAAACLGFIGAIYSKGGNVRTLGWFALSFVFGITASLVFLVICYVKARQTQEREAQFMAEVITESTELSWETNPRISGYTMQIVGSLIAGFGIFCFCFGAVGAIVSIIISK